MGFKMGVIVGFGAGYYLGAKAGRERYEQLNRWAQRIEQTGAYQSASARAKGMASEGVAVAKSRLSDRPGTDPGGHLPANGISNN